MADPLLQFVKNSETHPLSFGGVNNIVLLKCVLKEGFDSPFIAYNFTTQKEEPVTSIVFKILYAGTTREKFHNNWNAKNFHTIFKKKPMPVSIDEILKETRIQNEIYTKSFALYGKPICTPIFGTRIIDRSDKILSAFVATVPNFPTSVPLATREKYDNVRSLCRYLNEWRKKHKTAVIAMGELDSNYKTLRAYKGPFGEIDGETIELNEQTKYPIYAQLYKLRLLQYTHNDFHSDNIMIANPYITVKKEGQANQETLLFSYILGKTGATQEALLRKLDLEIATVRGYTKNGPDCILIDFGKAVEESEPFEPGINKKSPTESQHKYYNALRFGSDNFEGIAKEFQNHFLNINDNTPAAAKRARLNNLTEKIAKEIQKEREKWANSAPAAVAAPVAPTVASSPITNACILALEKETEQEKLTAELNEKSKKQNSNPRQVNALKRKLLTQLEEPTATSSVSSAAATSSSSAPTSSVSSAAATSSSSAAAESKENTGTGGLSLFGSNNNWGGGRRRTMRRKKRSSKRSHTKRR